MDDNANSKKPKDTWVSGEAYERYIGRWSRHVAREFIKWLSVSAGSQWLDVGCGTGALSQPARRAWSAATALFVR